MPVSKQNLHEGRRVRQARRGDKHTRVKPVPAFMGMGTDGSHGFVGWHRGRSDSELHKELQRRASPSLLPQISRWGAAAVAFRTCVGVLASPYRLCNFPDAQPRTARATNCHRRPAIDNSKTMSTRTTTIATTRTTTKRHDELDSHQPPPPPGPCHRQQQDNHNNNNGDDNDADNNDKMTSTTTTGYENNGTRRLRRDGELRRAFS
ncbi:hypothetical protein EDB85DRAFT_1901424 [Lactarius pseudohatsudake]|nr:hypothetical protein EDB85DRAFT_1901424 [Lactarius pseudohatsudake]